MCRGRDTLPKSRSRVWILGSLLGPLKYVEDQPGNKGLGKAGSYLNPLLPELFQKICHSSGMSRTVSSRSSIRIGRGIGLTVVGA